MPEFIQYILNTPVPGILVIIGFLFLVEAIVPVQVIISKPSLIQRMVLGILGGILSVGGLGLYIWLSISILNVTNPTPTVTTKTMTTAVNVSTIQPAPSSILNTSTPPSSSEEKIALTEVMAAPCGSKGNPSKNEYIELYNYGQTSSDVGGWWFATNNGGEAAHPNKIVSWDSRNPGIQLGSSVITNSTIMSPSQYAVILTPSYYQGIGQYHMPYIFPQGTILLTIEKGQFLGNDRTGLFGNADPLTVIVLYKGTSNIIEDAISTYGTPLYGSAIDSVRENGDGFPVPVDDCYSVQRKSALGHDEAGNWAKVLNGNPGEGPYVP